MHRRADGKHGGNRMYYETTVHVRVKQDIQFRYRMEKLAAFLDTALAKSSEYAAMHENGSFKYYSFSPLSSDARVSDRSEIGKVGTLCRFTVRTPDRKLAEYFRDTAKNTETEEYRGEYAEFKAKTLHYGEYISCQTPCAVTSGSSREEFALQAMNAKYMLSLANRSAVKKYNACTQGEKIPEETQVFDSLQVLSSVPDRIPFKGRTELGVRYKMHICCSSENAMKAAEACFAAGFFEKTARGFGYGFLLRKGV